MGISCSAIPLAGIALITVGACSSSPTTPPPTRSTTTGIECPNVSGQLVARNGELSAGPFSAEAIGPRPTNDISSGDWTKRKVWVADQRPGHDDAVIAVTPPSATNRRPTTYRRPASTASASGADQFWPGLIDIPTSGTWRLDITAGSDHMCVTVAFNR